MEAEGGAEAVGGGGGAEAGLGADGEDVSGAGLLVRHLGAALLEEDFYYGVVSDGGLLGGSGQEAIDGARERRCRH